MWAHARDTAQRIALPLANKVVVVVGAQSTLAYESALHPGAGSLVYRAAIPLSDETHGAALPQYIADLIAAVRARLLH